MTFLKDKDIEVGSHCWAIADEQLLIVLKTGKSRHKESIYEVCGAWECGMMFSNIDIIEVIKKPENHSKNKLYYLYEN